MKNIQIKRLIVLFCLVVIVYPSISQPWRGQFRDSEHHENIRSMKIAFITDRLSLTSEEAQQFWPLYNKYNEEMQEIREKYVCEIKNGDKSLSDVSEEKAAEYAEFEIRRIEEMAKLRREYHEKYLDVLSVKKVALLYEAEKDFKRHLFREMRRKQRRDRQQ